MTNSKFMGFGTLHLRSYSYQRISAETTPHGCKNWMPRWSLYIYIMRIPRLAELHFFFIAFRFNSWLCGPLNVHSIVFPAASSSGLAHRFWISSIGSRRVLQMQKLWANLRIHHKTLTCKLYRSSFFFLINVYSPSISYMYINAGVSCKPHGFSCLLLFSSSSGCLVVWNCCWLGTSDIVTTSSPGGASPQGCPQICDLNSHKCYLFYFKTKCKKVNKSCRLDFQTLSMLGAL